MRHAATATLLLGLGGLSCAELPGETIGTYAVTMKLEENSCGRAAVHSLDGKQYRAELRSDHKYGYWRVGGGKPLQGDYTDASFHFEFTAIVATSGPDAGPDGCRLQQAELLSGKLTGLDHQSDAELGEADDAAAEGDSDAADALDAGSADPSPPILDAGQALTLKGEHVLTVSAAAGAQCAEALAPQGPFEKLPCVVRYSLRGVDSEPF